MCCTLVSMTSALEMELAEFLWFIFLPIATCDYSILLIWLVELVWGVKLRCSTCPLVFGCWVLSHVIFLMLRKKELLVKLSKFTKWQLDISTQKGPRLSFWVKIVVILWLVQLCKQFFLSQLEKNHTNCLVCYVSSISIKTLWRESLLIFQLFVDTL